VQQSTVDAFLRALDRDSYSPPTDLPLDPELFNFLLEEGKVIRVSGEVIFSIAFPLEQHWSSSPGISFWVDRRQA
jgi:hypothetical protein